MRAQYVGQVAQHRHGVLGDRHAPPVRAAQRRDDRAVGGAHRHADVGAHPELGGDRGVRVMRVGGRLGGARRRAGEHPGTEGVGPVQPVTVGDPQTAAQHSREGEALGIKGSDEDDLHAEQLSRRRQDGVDGGVAQQRGRHGFMRWPSGGP